MTRMRLAHDHMKSIELALLPYLSHMAHGHRSSDTILDKSLYNRYPTGQQSNSGT